jgi:hypothetical protein
MPPLSRERISGLFGHLFSATILSSIGGTSSFPIQWSTEHSLSYSNNCFVKKRFIDRM